MAEICRDAGEAATNKGKGSGVARRRRMELRRMRMRSLLHLALVPHNHNKRQLDGLSLTSGLGHSTCPRYGMMSICGRRREMEDAVSIHPCFAGAPCQHHHFFAVFDGHGCSHVAELCKKRMHQIVAAELNQRLKRDTYTQVDKTWWREAMEKCFAQMDNEAVASGSNTKTMPLPFLPSCSCELRLPRSDHVGSTAVVAILGPRHLVVANCGDSRAVLCRNGSAVPLSSDHKPDRPDELQRIQAAGGRVIYWDGARVFGVLAMSRAIGDSYLKPFVISEPEVMVTETTEQDECLILATDGLWDVVSNEVACQLVSRCLRAAGPTTTTTSSNTEEEEDSHIENGSGNGEATAAGFDKACADAAMLLTELALARHTTDNVSVVVINLKRH
ncbi:Protein phosphatase 2C-like protein [Rhynchospora pubera]|uniref:protein-serine/threonine phosphatase n=1 Tax=Rhynchospora pubera TaxID=906938 RepID=A0AAV8F9U3_9POAL|nr:Protein phosphatase 2C-like protein [Rhynchospora pubera]